VCCGAGNGSASDAKGRDRNDEKYGRWSTTRIITIIVPLVMLALVIYLKATGVV
jgi:hypothetical protein